jgi:hypothetical protein
MMVETSRGTEPDMDEDTGVDMGGGMAREDPAAAPPASSAASMEEAARRADRIGFVRAEIARWRAAGLVQPRLAARLLAEYEPHGRRHDDVPAEDAWPRFSIPLTPGLVLLFIGGILVLSAVIMLLAQSWKELGEAGRAAVGLLPTLALFGWAGYLKARAPSQRSTAALLAFFACLLTPLALWLLVDALTGGGPGDHISKDTAVFVALLTLAVHVGALAAFRSPLLTLPYPLSALWLAIQAAVLATGPSGGAGPAGAALILAGVLLMAAGYAAAASGRPTYAAMPDLFGSLALMSGLTTLGADGHKPGWELLMAAGSLGFVAASVWRRNQRYLLTGALFTIISVFDLGFEYFEDTAGLPVTLIVCGLLSMGVGFAVQRVRKEYLLADEPD